MSDVKDGSGKPVQAAVDPWSLPPTQADPYWPLGLSLDMHVYLSTSPNGDVDRKDNDESLPHFVWENITYGDYNDHRVLNFEVKFPDVSVRLASAFLMLILWLVLKVVTLRNGSLWADIFLTRDSVNSDPRSPSFDPARIHHVRKRTFSIATSAVLKYWY